jgi:membrane associated rhomboid family serine protease
MFSAIPHDELESGRLPWVTWTLVALCTAAGLARAFGLDIEAARLGVEPGALSAQGFAAHWLFNETVLQWIVTTGLLLLLGPHLEAAWGARVYAGFLAVATVFGAGVYALIGPAERPLVGLSAAVAGTIVALIARHGTASVRTYVLAPSKGPVGISFEAPVVAALGLWFVGEVLLTFAAHGSGPTRGLGTILPIAGTVCGFAAAMAVRSWGLEEAIEEGGETRVRAHPALAAAQAARDAGRPSAAVGLLETAVRTRPHDAELVRALCDAACAAGETSRAAEPLRRFLTEQVRLGEVASAAGFWRAFGSQVAPVKLDPRTALALAESLAASGDKPLAARMLRDALAASPRMSPGIALRFAEVAAPLHRETALRAGKIALAAEGLDEAKRAKLEARVAALESSSGEDDVDLSPPPVVEKAVKAAAAAPKKQRPEDRALDVELDPLYSTERPANIAPPVEKSAAFALSADGSKESGAEEQDLSLALPDTDPILLPASDADDGRDAFGTAGPGMDLSNEVVEPTANPATASAPRAATRLTRLPPPPELPPSPPPAPAAAPLDDPLDGAAFAAADGPRFHELKCVEAVPLTLDDSGLTLRNGPQLDLSRVDGIAVAAVQGMAAKPVILVDLLLNWTEMSDAPLRTVRLRSDQFDPRTLFPQAGGGLESFRAMLDALHARAGATPLPDPDAARGRPFKMYPDLARYEREVLQVER